MSVTNRIVALHGVNLGQLGRRPSEHYGTITLPELERQVGGWAREVGLDVTFMQTDDESEYIGALHRAADMADGLLLNAGAWTHYAWSIHDALELVRLPAIEVHLSDVQAREEFRRHSVISSLCLRTVSGEGPEGYRTALQALAEHLGTQR